jgi:hypothetical protein
MNNLLSINLYPPGGFTGFGPLGNPNPGNVSDASGSVNVFAKFLSSIIGVLTVVGIIWFIIVLITGAISWIGAGNDKNAVENAKKKITNGIIGLIITITAVLILDLFGTLLGIPGILNIGALFKLL